MVDIERIDVFSRLDKNEVKLNKSYKSVLTNHLTQEDARMYMKDLKRKILLQKCREREFVNYKKLNNIQLQELLKRGYHYITPKQPQVEPKSTWVKADRFDSSQDVMRIAPFSCCGYIVRGIDLDGMFDSIYTPFVPLIRLEGMESSSSSEEEDTDDDDEEVVNQQQEEDEGVDVVEVKEKTTTTEDPSRGWIVPSYRYEELISFYHRMMKRPPRSLKELATNVVCSRKLSDEIKLEYRNILPQNLP